MSSFDPGPFVFFSQDHRRCDELWAELEASADLDLWKDFERSMRRHLAMEEEVLFPALEAATGMHGVGPTYVMRMEHAQMRQLLDTMGAAAERGDLEAVLDQGDTLLMLIQQHNAKEENMLYPLADQALAERWPEMSAELRAYPIS